jgi:hypothetical protein
MFFVRDMLRIRIPKVCFYFFPWNGIPSIFLLCGMVRNGIPRDCFYFCSMVRNSKHSAERFGTEFREFYVPQYNRNSAGTKPIVPSIPSTAEYFFCRKLPTLAQRRAPEPKQVMGNRWSPRPYAHCCRRSANCTFRMEYKYKRPASFCVKVNFS